MMVLYKYSDDGVIRSLALYVTGLIAPVTALSMIAVMASLGVFWQHSPFRIDTAFA
jgi:hypothetical protein